MSIKKLEQAARAACLAPGIAAIFDDPLPPGFDANNPSHLRHLLVQVCEGTDFAHSAAYRAAHAALYECEQAYSLRDRVAAIANNPQVQLAASGRGLDFYMSHPAAARQALRDDPKLAAQLGANLVHEINLVAIEAQQFAQEHGIPDAPPPSEIPISANAGSRETEIETLRTKSVNRTITKAEDVRLTKIYEARIASGEMNAAEGADALRSHRKALGIPDKPDEYKALIGRSLDGKLSPAEHARLTQLSGQRAVEQGLATQDDIDAEEQSNG